ncbi:MAG: hypothetical protein LUC87_00760 [Clostridiales bacterium]|nr:hypothetical protein [Clostridiales bacterium]MCD8367208.1 hypothetical protein [Clostridiales bacterium]
MSDKPLETAWLVGDSNFLHLKESTDGFSYEVFHTGQPRKVAAGQISVQQVEKSPIRSPLAAARTLAIAEARLNGGRVARVSVNMLERFVDSDVRRRRIWEPETLPDNDIRFITSDYRELFRIPNGGTILVDYPDRHFAARCEHLDDYHTRINGEVFHICQFAELLERNGGTCRPEPELLRDEAAWRLGSKNYLTVQACESGWDYSIYDQSFHTVDGGQLDRPELSILEARDAILLDNGMQNRSRTQVGYEFVTEKAEAVEEREGAAKRESVLGQLSTLKEIAPEPKTGSKRSQEASL